MVVGKVRLVKFNVYKTYENVTLDEHILLEKIVNVNNLCSFNNCLSREKNNKSGHPKPKKRMKVKPGKSITASGLNKCVKEK